MPDLSWLTARPIAHRGLHNPALGVVENTPTAVMQAIEGRFGVEVDVQATAEGEALVFHDATLDRLTGANGLVLEYTIPELRRIRFQSTTDPMWTLGELFELVDGRVPVVVELKSFFNQAIDIVDRVRALAAAYKGPLVVKSFDPWMIETFRILAPKVPRGIVGESFTDNMYWGHLSERERFRMRHMLHVLRTRPQVISWNVNDLPAVAPRLARMFGAKLITWTVRTPAQQAHAKVFADQMIFEGFVPKE